MGLTASSTGQSAIITANGSDNCDIRLALAGNPNVGKSTVFNALTGMRQHTGNWAGKTVAAAYGECEYCGKKINVIDLPGTYSLSAQSAEEEIARDYVCFGNADVIAVICDATRLERNMNLVLQTLEIRSNVIVCVNLIDEAAKNGITVDCKKLSQAIGVPVIPMAARSKRGIDEFLQAVIKNNKNDFYDIKYPKKLENAVKSCTERLSKLECKSLNPKWIALRFLENDTEFIQKLCDFLPRKTIEDSQLEKILCAARESITESEVTDATAKCAILSAEYICEDVFYEINKHSLKAERIDKILTGKLTGIPIMLCLLLFVFWLTIYAANHPSQLLQTALFKIEDWLLYFAQHIGAPEWLSGITIKGGYRVLAWVVSVMLPPMAVFFPLFTLLEDLGYLPRIAFNMDYGFAKAGSCGKQALTMCMGFGCNAAGVVGCRIIESPRERLIATITNNFVPCNGRYPTLIAIITMFFVSAYGGFETLKSALLLLTVILTGVFVTLLVSRALSATLLKGVPSSFALELPPLRAPQLGKVIIRSVFDRTIFVLGRAAVVSIPAGMLIWLLANITIDGTTLLNCIADILNPFASLFGLDGVILLAFILGFPANEIVIPIAIMTYMGSGVLLDYGSLDSLKILLTANGWTSITAISVMLFCMFHWPCSTTCLTIKKETGGFK